MLYMLFPFALSGNWDEIGTRFDVASQVIR